MSRFNAFKKSTRNGKSQKKFKHNDKNEKKNSRWDGLKTNENSFSKDSNNFSNNNFSNKSNFKGRRRNKRIYKSKISKEELDKQMALRGSRQMGISFDDILTKKVNKTKKSSEKTKQLDKKVVKSEPKKLPENEKMSDSMKYFIMNQFYEEEEEEESYNEEGKIENNTKKDEDFIGFN